MKTQLFKTNQQRLKDLGWYSGNVDGIDGALSQGAMARFKRESGFIFRPFPGPLTLARLWATDAAKAPKPDPANDNSLVEIAMSYDGLREIKGSRHNATILRWLKDLRLPWSDDETAWCGTFVGGVVLEWDPDAELPANPAGARQWLKAGEHVDDDDVRPGDIAVYWRGSPNGWKGHVNIVVRVIRDASGNVIAVDCVGGNQSDAVNVRRYTTVRSRKDCRLLGFRRLEGATAGKPVTIAEKISTGGSEA